MVKMYYCNFNVFIGLNIVNIFGGMLVDLMYRLKMEYFIFIIVG